MTGICCIPEVHNLNTGTFQGCDYRQVLDWWLDLLHTYTTCYYTSQIATRHSMSSQAVTVFTSCYLITNVNNGYSVLKSRTEFMSTVNWSNWVPGWRPFHTHLCLLFTGRLSTELTTDLSPQQPATSCHFTQLNRIIKIKVKVILWLVVYSQSVLVPSPLRFKTRDFFFYWTLWS
jgi:hypothetical protein